MTHGPISEEYRKMMNDLAGLLDDMFNGPNCKPADKTTGFCLLMFPFGESAKNRINYISNADRKDMLVALKEYTARLEGRVLETAEVQ